MILAILTQLFGVGGIERIGRHTAVVLEAYAREIGMPCRIYSLNEPTGTHELNVGGSGITIHGFGRNKIQLIRNALKHARNLNMLYLGHPRLAPLSCLLRVVNPRIYCVTATYGIEVWAPLPLPYRLCLKMANTITTLSTFSARKIAERQGIPLERIVVIPPALDPEFTHRKDDSHTTAASRSQVRTLLTVARLVSSEGYKGIDTVIYALRKIIPEFPNVQYIVVGDGDDRPKLMQLARESGVADRVHFVGSKSGDALAHYYSTCDIFVMPSSGEGFGMVFLEAMSFGKPVIGGDHGGTPEVIDDGVTGFLVKYGDDNGLARLILALLKDEGTRQMLGQNARKRILERYTFQNFRDRLWAVLLEGSRWKS